MRTATARMSTRGGPPPPMWRRSRRARRHAAEGPCGSRRCHRYKGIDRVLNEHELFSRPEGCEAGPLEGYYMGLQWTASITGPRGSPYEGGVFRLDITFPADYPRSPPTVRFTTPIYHQNVDGDGNISLVILQRSGWRRSHTIWHVLEAARALLSAPEPEAALMPESARIYKTDRRKYNKLAK